MQKRKSRVTASRVRQRRSKTRQATGWLGSWRPGQVEGEGEATKPVGRSVGRRGADGADDAATGQFRRRRLDGGKTMGTGKEGGFKCLKCVADVLEGGVSSRTPGEAGTTQPAYWPPAPSQFPGRAPQALLLPFSLACPPRLPCSAVPASFLPSFLPPPASVL